MPKSAAHRLHEDLQDLSTEITDHLRDAAEKTGEDAAAALKKSSDALARAARRLGHDLSDRARDGTDLAVRTGLAHPAVTAVMAAAAVAMIGYLIARPRMEF